MFIYKFIKNDIVDYVGITSNIEKRIKQHCKNSSWVTKEHKILFSKMPNRATALCYEIYLINYFTPKFNKKDNYKDDVSCINFDFKPNWITYDKELELNEDKRLNIDELIDINLSIKNIDKSNFVITYITYYLGLFNLFGTKKMKVIEYIFKHMNMYNNTLIITTNELATKTKVSKPIVIETLKILEEKELITRRVGSLMLNDKILNEWENQKEKYLLTKFEIFNEKE